jgi:predicted SnoaL-like aldol condensation-catalyzing enzyme
MSVTHTPLRPLSLAAAFATAFAATAGADPMKDIATGLLVQGIAGGDIAYVEAHVAEDYIQHNPTVPDGRAGLIGLIEGTRSIEGGVEVTPVRVLLDGDLVAVHSDASFGSAHVVIVDLFRFEDGQVAEHWDIIQPRPETTVSGRGMTDGSAEILDLDRTEANRQLVLDFYREVLIEGHLDRSGAYLGSEYRQHNPQVADGLDGLTAFFTHLRESGIPVSLDTIHRSIAEGNFVLLHVEGTIAGAPHAFFDLFRVEDGRVVEHWDVIQAVPAEMPHQNGMF